MRLLLWMVEFACGCHHRRLSNVLTIKKRTYQVRLDCGREFGYSRELMHSVRSNGAPVSVPLNCARRPEVAVV